MFRHVRSCCGLLVATMAFIGCAGSGPRADTDYRTVRDAPGRDTELARQHHSRALDLIDAEEYDEAERALRQSLQADVMFGPAHNNLGKVYFKQRRLYQAAWEFQYAARLMPHHPEPRNNLGLVFEDVGQLDEAVDHYREAMKISPDNPQLIGNLARARIRRGDRDEKLVDLLQQLVGKDTRPEWVQWARERLALMHIPKS